MKKRLLTLALTAVVAVGSYAYNVGDYIYTKTAKLKIEGQNLVQNGDFSAGFEGWTNEINGEVSNWVYEDGAGPTGNERAIKASSQSTDEGTTLMNVWQLTPGVYAISYQAFFPSTVTTSVSEGGNYYVNFFANADASTTITRAIADLQTFEAEKWTEVVDTIFVNTDQEFLVFNAKNVPAGTMFTNFTINRVNEVYDTRIVEKKIAFAKQLMADANLDTEAAAAAKETLAETITLIEGEIEAGELEDAEGGAADEQMLADAQTDFLDATTINITQNKYFQWVEDLTTMNKYNRKALKGNTQYGGFMFRQDGAATGAETNWVHGENADYISKWILKGNTNGPGSVALYSDKMPGGKYFVSMDVRTGTAGRGSNDWSTVWDITTNAKAFVNADSASLVAMDDGERYIRIYAIGEVKEGDPLEAGVWWESMEGNNPTPEFFVTNFEIRSFGDVATVVDHKSAFAAFKAQYDAATNRRNSIAAMQADKQNYVWKQDSLQSALNTWVPYQEAVASWIDADGKDTGVASTEQLNDWAEWQGVEIYKDNDEGEPVRQQYQVVRQLQAAIDYVKAENQPIADLTADIAAAKSTLNDDKNSLGDKATFQNSISAAEAVLSDIQTNSTDAKKEADVARIATAQAELAAATEVFLKSAELTPIVDIDFSNGFEIVLEDDEPIGYVIKGAAGQMNFTTDVTLDNSTGDTNYTLGSAGSLNDVLRLGKSWATVDIPEPADNEVVRVEFDLWVGSLIKRFLTVQLQNAEGEKIGGFELNRYDSVLNFNDFNNEANTGLDILKYVTSLGSSSQNDAAICVDDNKSSFALILDYKAQAMKGIVVNGKNGTCEGGYVPFAKDVTNTKVAKFAIKSAYDNAGRRCWFDNLKVFKYASAVDGPVDTGIQSVAPAKVANGAIYTISGVRVNSASKPGLYIIDGKKVAIQ